MPVYPLRLTGIVLEVRSHVIHVDRLLPVLDSSYYLSGISIGME
jgi:hypothetical protein